MLHPNLPPNPTKLERDIIEQSIINFYTNVDSPVDMFLVAFIYELGYKKSLAADILNCSNGSITYRLNRLKKKLKKTYKGYEKSENKSVK